MQPVINRTNKFLQPLGQPDLPLDGATALGAVEQRNPSAVLHPIFHFLLPIVSRHMPLSAWLEADSDFARLSIDGLKRRKAHVDTLVSTFA